MKRVKIELETPHPDAIRQAVEVLKRGGVIVYPTDTCYGLGVDARNESAVRRLVAMKSRDHAAKPFSVIVRSVADIKKITQTSDTIDRMLQTYLPGPFTFVLINLDFRISRSSSVGVRIPRCPVTSMLAAEFGAPYTTTSANQSGLQNPYSYTDIEQNLLIPLKIRNEPLPDLILDAGPLKQTDPSTIVDLTHDKPKILRQGSGVFGS